MIMMVTDTTPTQCVYVDDESQNEPVSTNSSQKYKIPKHRRASRVNRENNFLLNMFILFDVAGLSLIMYAFRDMTIYRMLAFGFGTQFIVFGIFLLTLKSKNNNN